jgi:hypothetical protein
LLNVLLQIANKLGLSNKKKFIRGVDADFNITEELLALQQLKGTTTGEDIFENSQDSLPEIRA